MRIALPLFDLEDQKIVETKDCFIDLLDDHIRIKIAGLMEEKNAAGKLTQYNRCFDSHYKRESLTGLELVRCFDDYGEFKYWKLIFVIHGATETYMLIKKYETASDVRDKVLKYILEKKEPVKTGPVF